MPCWYFEKEDLRNTPSIQNGLEYATEVRYRHEGAKFIITCGTKLGLRCDTFATGVVFFHRFYMFHSFKSFPRYVTSACCLLLAGKIEETPKKCRDIVKVARSILSDHHFAQFGQDPREEVMSLERVLLKTIKFDLQADHPYRHLLQYGKKIRGDKEKIQSMMQMAWTFTNDSLCTTLCLQWEPDIVACALLYLATKLSKFEIEDWENRERSSAGKWWEHFVPGMSLEVMEDICHQILDLYSKPAGGGVGGPGLSTSAGLGGASATAAAQAAGPSTATSETSTSSRRKRKADSIGGGYGGPSESVATQAGSGRSARSSRSNTGTSATVSASSSANAYPPVSTVAGYPGGGHAISQPGNPSASMSYGSYSDPAAGIAALAASMPDQASQYYAVLARQQQAAAAAAAAVYGGSNAAPASFSGTAPAYGQPPPPPTGYPGQAAGGSGGGMPIASTNPPLRIPPGKLPSGNAGAPQNSGNFNPSVRITQRR